MQKINENVVKFNSTGRLLYEMEKIEIDHLGNIYNRYGENVETLVKLQPVEVKELLIYLSDMLKRKAEKIQA